MLPKSSVTSNLQGVVGKVGSSWVFLVGSGDSTTVNVTAFSLILFDV